MDFSGIDLRTPDNQEAGTIRTMAAYAAVIGGCVKEVGQVNNPVCTANDVRLASVKNVVICSSGPLRPGHPNDTITITSFTGIFHIRAAALRHRLLRRHRRRPSGGAENRGVGAAAPGWVPEQHCRPRRPRHRLLCGHRGQPDGSRDPDGADHDQVRGRFQGRNRRESGVGHRRKHRLLPLRDVGSGSRRNHLQQLERRKVRNTLEMRLQPDRRGGRFLRPARRRQLLHHGSLSGQLSARFGYRGKQRHLL